MAGDGGLMGAWSGDAGRADGVAALLRSVERAPRLDRLSTGLATDVGEALTWQERDRWRGIAMLDAVVARDSLAFRPALVLARVLSGRRETRRERQQRLVVLASRAPRDTAVLLATGHAFAWDAWRRREAAAWPPPRAPSR